MSKKKIVQLTSIGFLSIGVLLLLPGTNWHDKYSVLAFVSVLLGTLGSVISIFIPSNYTLYFGASDWNEDENSKYITVVASKHGHGTSPTVQLFAKDGNSYQEVIAAVGHDNAGSVTVSGSKTIDFAGKIVIS